jgi:hypothetical protein
MKKISLGNKGKKKSEEHKKNMSIGKMNKKLLKNLEVNV